MAIFGINSLNFWGGVSWVELQRLGSLETSSTYAAFIGFLQMERVGMILVTKDKIFRGFSRIVVLEVDPFG